MTARPRFALITFGDFSHINTHVREQALRVFPGHEPLLIDLSRLLRAAPLRRLGLWAAALAEYGTRALAGRPVMRALATKTPRFHETMREFVARELAGSGCEFTLQTQSMFDASQPGVPHFVYTDHTHLANFYYPGFDLRQLHSGRWIALERATYHNATRVFTMSSHVSRSLVELYRCDEARVRCVYAGSNIVPPQATELDEARYASQRILFVGIDWERKGGPLLARAFELVLRRFPAARLTIIGCSPRLDLPNCEVLGRLPLPEVAQHYRRAAIFCMPTQVEPFGIVFLEACAYRLPVVSTRLGALPDIVREGETGHLVPHDDAEQLAARLCALLASPETCRRYGEAGFAQASARYTWEAAGNALAQEIRAALERPDAPFAPAPPSL